MLLLRDTFLKK